MRVEWLGENERRKRQRTKLFHKYNSSEFGRALWVELTATESFSSLPVVHQVHPLLYQTHVAFEKMVAYRRNCNATRTCDYLGRTRLCYQAILTFSRSLSLFFFSLPLLFSFSQKQLEWITTVRSGMSCRCSNPVIME